MNALQPSIPRLGNETCTEVFFAAYGFAVAPGLLRDDIATISDAFDEVFGDPSNERLPWAPVGHRWNPQHIMPNFIERHPRLAGLAADPRVLDLLERLLGTPTTFVGDDASIFCCETEWHYDTPQVVPDRHHVKVAVYLEPIDAATGAIRVMPGSHLASPTTEGPLAPFLGFDGEIDARTGIVGERLPFWSLDSTPGDVLVWDYRILHASYGSTEPRRQFALNYRVGDDEPL